MSPSPAFPWKSALRLGTGLMALALTAPVADSAAISCNPSTGWLPPPGFAAPGPDNTCAKTALDFFRLP